MHRILARWKSALAALLVAVLVVLPVADAYACSFEFDTEHAPAAAHVHEAPVPDDGAGRDGGPDDAHGACAHNHCHHSKANISFGAVLGYAPVGAVRPSHEDRMPVSGRSEGPRRPPRS